MNEAVTSAAIKFLAWSMPFLLRKIYPISKLSSLVKVRISTESDGIEFWGGDIPKAKARIQITNLSPVEIEIDRAYGAFSFGAWLENFHYLRREKIPPSSEINIYIETSLHSGHIAVINSLKSSNPQPSIQFNAMINSKIHSFEILRSLETSHCQLKNFQNAG